MRYHGDLLFKIIPGLKTQFVYEVNSQNVQQHDDRRVTRRTIKNAYAKMDTESHKLVLYDSKPVDFFRILIPAETFLDCLGS